MSDYETQVGVAPDAPTVLAYSQAEPVFDYPATGPQPTVNTGWATARIAATFLAVMIGAAVAIFWGFHHHKDSVGPPVTMMTPTVTATATATVTVTPDTQTPDELYTYLYSQATGRTLYKPGEATAAISLGHAQCDYLALGRTANEAAIQIEREYPEATRQEAYGIVQAAIAAYCPQYKS